MLTRRSFFSFTTSLIAAPPIIKLAPIMAIKPFKEDDNLIEPIYGYGRSPLLELDIDAYKAYLRVLFFGQAAPKRTNQQISALNGNAFRWI